MLQFIRFSQRFKCKMYHKLLVVTSITLLFPQNTRCSVIHCGPCRCYKDNDALTADCSHRDLSNVPLTLPNDTEVLNLSYNKISAFNYCLEKYRKLSHLDASNNHFSTLSMDDFLGVEELKVLDLHNNNLTLSYSSYPVLLFQNLKNLTELIIHGNSPVEGFYYPYFTILKLISLKTLIIDGLRYSLYKNPFNGPETLENLTFTGNCGLRFLSNMSFSNLIYLKYLSITNCELLHIEASAFSGMESILELDISHNPYLGIPNTMRGLYGLQHSSLKILKANYVRLWTGLGTIVTEEDMKYISNMESLEELHIDYNHLELFEVTAPLLLPKSVKKLSMRNNAFSFGIYLLTGGALGGLQYLDASGNDRSHANPFAVSNMIKDLRNARMKGYRLPRSVHETEVSRLISVREVLHNQYEPWPGDVLIPIPGNATFGNFSHSKLHFYITEYTFAENRVEKLDLSFNFFSRWSGPTKGLDKLEYIDLSHNYCDSINDSMNENLPSLKILNVSSNYLGYTLTNNTFANLTVLELLDLSENKIISLPKSIFRNNNNLKILKLRGNLISTWDIPLVNMKNLSQLDLSGNFFEEMPKLLMEEIDNLPIRRLKLKFHNPLLCTCQTLSSLKWIHTHMSVFEDFQAMHCKDRRIFSNLDDIITELENKCATYIGVLFGTLCFVTMTLSLAFVGAVYRHRWKLRYLYYLARNKYRKNMADENEHNFEFDAFISYADEDRGIVVSEMRQRLEDNNHLKLCIHHRDFLPGEAIAANILNALKSSRKVVVMLSRNFLKSYWCRYEVEMAKLESIHTGRDMLLIVVLERIPVKEIPADILDVMLRDTYLEYSGEVEEVFWENLSRALRV